MTGTQITYIIIMAASLLMSGIFSAAETALSSMNKTRLKNYAEEGNKRAALVLKLCEREGRLFSMLQIGNAIVNLIMASLGTLLFASLFATLGATVSLVISIAVCALLLLLFGEIMPKSIAKEFPEKIAMRLAFIVRLLYWILFPLIAFFAIWRRLLSKLFHSKEDNKMSQEELLMLVEEVQQEGSIDQDEGSLLKNVIEFTDLKAEEILTHRVDLEGFAVGTSKEEIAKQFTETKFSRLLAYEEDLDHIVGVLHQKDFYSEKGITDREIADLMTEPLFIPEATKISDLLKQLQINQSHLAVVVGEYGETVGIVTMEDILEELVGEIWDEHDEVVEVFHQIDETTCQMGGDVELSDFSEHYGVELESTSSTLNGWISEQLEKIAEEGDTFVYQNLSVTVLETDSHRASFVEVVILPETAQEETETEDQSEEKTE